MQVICICQVRVITTVDKIISFCYYICMPYIKRLLLIIFLVFPIFVYAQESYYQAKVIEVVEEYEYTREDDSIGYNQYLKLEILSKQERGKIIEVNNLNSFDIISDRQYKSGDKVLVASYDTGETIRYEITDYVRTGSLFWLGFIFFVLIIIVGKWKGLRALVGLVLSFLIIMYFIVPRILEGNNPLLIGISGAFVILCALIYITEGWNKLAHISILSIAISLSLTAVLAIIFTQRAGLSGGGSDEALFLIGISNQVLNLKGLLLTGIIIGTLGVLDDVVVSQVSLVAEIKSVNPNLSSRDVFKRAMKVGITHIGAMTNTLFLAYAGASLPLLLLFSVHNPPFLKFIDVVNNELIATEIIRTLTGSIGLALAAPIATAVAVLMKNSNISVSHKKH
jgi:uncharacterized membrane protein